jgi:hypothetical protein
MTRSPTDCNRLHGRDAENGPWIVSMVCIFGDVRPGLGYSFLSLVLRLLELLACLLATSQLLMMVFRRDAMEIVKIYDYKPAWIARYDVGMITGLGSSQGGT